MLANVSVTKPRQLAAVALADLGLSGVSGGCTATLNEAFEAAKELKEQAKSATREARERERVNGEDGELGAGVCVCALLFSFVALYALAGNAALAEAMGKVQAMMLRGGATPALQLQAPPDNSE